jgi:hypothetical protein
MGVFAVCLWVLVAALGCNGTSSAPLEPAEQDLAIRPTLGIDENIADLVLSAVVMWQGATGGLYAPEIHLGCDGTEAFCIREVPGMLTECLGPDDAGAFNGCCDSAHHEIRLSEAMYLDQKISTLAHELGHSLGLKHGQDGLMAVERVNAERHSPCIDQATLDAFAARHGADLTTLTTTCYGDAVRAAMLEQLDAVQ